MIVGDFSQVLIGMRTSGVRIQVLDAGAVGSTNAVSQMLRWVRAFLRADMVLMQETFFSKLAGVQAKERR